MQKITMTISRNKLIEEQTNVLLFKNSARGKKSPIMFPKKLITNRSESEDIIQFDIPKWLADKMEYEVDFLNNINYGKT